GRRDVRTHRMAVEDDLPAVPSLLCRLALASDLRRVVDPLEPHPADGAQVWLVRHDLGVHGALVTRLRGSYGRRLRDWPPLNARDNEAPGKCQQDPDGDADDQPLHESSLPLTITLARVLAISRQLRADRPFQIGVGLLEFRLRLDVLDVHRLQRARRVDEGEPVDAARLIGTLGDAQRLLRLGDMG